jgi:hypothetical protein
MALAVASLWPAVPAHAAGMAMWRPDDQAAGVFPPGALRDGRLRTTARVSVRSLRTRGLEVPVRIFYTSKGEPVRVVVSSRFVENAETLASAQSYVNFLAGRLHGSEISRLTSYLAPLREVQELCGLAAVGCYAPSRQLLVVPGENTPPGEYSKEFVATHEYGHHIARNRDNYPWSALSYGPKHWARVHEICERVADGKLWPGDQGKHYFQDPGEGWAQAYGLYHYPHTPWRYSRFTRPIGRTSTAIRTDVLAPWGGPRTWVQRGVLHGGATRSFATPLDGRVVIRLTAARNAGLGVESIDGPRSSRVGSRVAVANVCGTTRVGVRLSGSGRYTLIARIP